MELVIVASLFTLTQVWTVWFVVRQGSVFANRMYETALMSEDRVRAEKVDRNKILNRLMSVLTPSAAQAQRIVNSSESAEKTPDRRRNGLDRAREITRAMQAVEDQLGVAEDPLPPSEYEDEMVRA